ncbi:hypothetical protein PG988_006795 [Apiospora saccharicola]
MHPKFPEFLILPYLTLPPIARREQSELVDSQLEPPHRVDELGVVHVEAVVLRLLVQQRPERLAELPEVELLRLEQGRVPDRRVVQVEQVARQLGRPPAAAEESGPAQAVVAAPEPLEGGGEGEALDGGVLDARPVNGRAVGLDGAHRVLGHEGRDHGPDGGPEPLFVRRVGDVPSRDALGPRGEQSDKGRVGVGLQAVGEVVQHREERVRVRFVQLLLAEDLGAHADGDGRGGVRPARRAAGFQLAVHVRPVGHQALVHQGIVEVVALAVYNVAVATEIEEPGVEDARVLLGRHGCLLTADSGLSNRKWFAEYG